MTLDEAECSPRPRSARRRGGFPAAPASARLTGSGRDDVVTGEQRIMGRRRTAGQRRWVAALVVAGTLVLGGCAGPLSPLGAGSGRTSTPLPTSPADPSLLRIVADDTGAVSVQVPATWNDVADVGFTDEAGVAWRAVAAAPSLAEFGQSASAAGAQVMAAPDTGQTAEATFLALSAAFDDTCALTSAPAAYRDAVHVGVFAVWDCAGTDAVLVSVLNGARDNVVAIVQVASDVERDIGLGAILSSFRARL